MRNERTPTHELRLSKETLRRIEPAPAGRPGLFPLPTNTLEPTGSGTCPP
ncbi:MAG TPA: hypothetical protein VHM02_08260 [Thermoanaerobaculia bacterium]|nr:hypothetical protein [Thermoanaerobaculia bacterium]